MRRKRTAAEFPFNRLVWNQFVILSLMFLTALPDAHAYIDPGSGALLWQVLLAAIIGAVFYIRSICRLVMSWICQLRHWALGKRG
jgi:hypothetical protein